MGVRQQLHRVTRAIPKHLADLEPEKRLLAYLDAIAKGDKAAATALYNAAPQAEYKMTAWPFQGMVDGLPVVILATVADILATGFALYHSLSEVIHRDGAANDDADKPLDIEGLLCISDLTLAPWQALRRFLVDDVGISENDIEAHVPNHETVKAVVATAEYGRKLYLDSWLGYLADMSELDETEKHLSQHRQEAAERLEGMIQNALAVIRQLWHSYYID